MKITIPVFDSYIEKCKSTGVKPIFESFTEEHTETIAQVDPALFEAYQAYKEDTRIISILEYQSIKSYSEFLENEEELANMPEDEEEEVEDSEASVDNEEEVEAGEESEDDDDDEEEEESEEEAEVEDSEAATDSEESEEEAEVKDSEPDTDSEEEEEEEEEEEVEEGAEVKKAEHGPEKEAKVKELPATDDDFGIEIDIETFGKDIDASFKEIEDEIMKMGEPDKEDEKDGEELIGEESHVTGRQLTEEEILEAKDENNIIVDFLFRRPKIQKTVKKAVSLKVQAAQAEIKAQEMIAKKNEDMDVKIAQLKEKGASSDQISKFKDKNKENLKKFEETLDKKIDIADENAKEIDGEADEMASSNYLKKVLSKARVDGSLEVAKARFAGADETEQAELKDRMKEMQMEAAEAQKELDLQDGETKKKVKDLGLQDKDYEALDKINTKLDNIKDKEKVVSNKIANAKEGEEKEGLQKKKDELNTEKFGQWTEASKILDNVKDKEKRGSMYRTLTGVSEISNSAEMEDYIETKTKEAEERGKAPETQDPGTQDPGTQDPDGNKEQKKKEIEQKLSTATSKLEGAKKKLGEVKNDPSADPKAVAAIENNVKSLEAEVKKLNDEKGNLGESTETFELNLNNLISKIDEVVSSIDNLIPLTESNKYESVAQRFRKAYNKI